MKIKVSIYKIYIRLGLTPYNRKSKIIMASICKGLFPDSSVGKESTRNAGKLGSIPGLGRSPGEGKGYPLQNSGLENSMDCVVHGVVKSWTGLNDFHFQFQMDVGMVRLVWQLQRDACLFTLSFLIMWLLILKFISWSKLTAKALAIMSASQYQERGIQEGQRAFFPAKSAPRAIFQEILYQFPLTSHWLELSNIPSSYK